MIMNEDRKDGLIKYMIKNFAIGATHKGLSKKKCQKIYKHIEDYLVENFKIVLINTEKEENYD